MTLRLISTEATATWTDVYRYSVETFGTQRVPAEIQFAATRHTIVIQLLLSGVGCSHTLSDPVELSTSLQPPPDQSHQPVWTTPSIISLVILWRTGSNRSVAECCKECSCAGGFRSGSERELLTFCFPPSANEKVRTHDLLEKRCSIVCYALEHKASSGRPFLNLSSTTSTFNSLSRRR